MLGFNGFPQPQKDGKKVGKQSANGQTVVPSTSPYDIVVSGLTFSPKVALVSIEANDAKVRQVYWADRSYANLNNAAYIDDVQASVSLANTNDPTGSLSAVRKGFGMNSNGFKLTVASAYAGRTVYWQVYE